PVSEPQFIIDSPEFSPATGEAAFSYRLGELHFVETLRFPTDGLDAAMAGSSAFATLLNLTAAVLGVSYFKLLAPFGIDASALSLSKSQTAFLIDVYENGLGEFYARNNLKRFGRLTLTTGPERDIAPVT